jgi:tetratricopeptide (TPR) repeat protein
MKIVRDDEHSSALYYNIANAHYKLNSIGPSIYYYEKALQLAPNDKEILNNLAFAQNATVDAIEPLPKTIFAKWDTTLSSWLTFNGWAWVTVISAVLFALFLLLYYFSVYSVKKRLSFVGAIFMFLLIMFGLTMSYRNYNKQVKDQPAIIFTESSNIKADPSSKSETSFILHEGTKVQIIAEDEDWYRILLVDGKDGWIHQTDLKAL